MIKQLKPVARKIIQSSKDAQYKTKLFFKDYRYLIRKIPNTEDFGVNAEKRYKSMLA